MKSPTTTKISFRCVGRLRKDCGERESADGLTLGFFGLTLCTDQLTDGIEGLLIASTFRNLKRQPDALTGESPVFLSFRPLARVKSAALPGNVWPLPPCRLATP